MRRQTNKHIIIIKVFYRKTLNAKMLTHLSNDAESIVKMQQAENAN